jgi:tetratricopeptide (TPR) repeat protein
MSTSEIFQNSVCLSQEVLIRYVKNELNAAEKRGVELHLADCEICFDAVEGLILIESNRLNAIQQELSNRIEKRIQQDEKVKVIPVYKRWYSMAAAIAALIMISVYVVNVYEKDTDLAQAETAKLPVTENNPVKEQTEALTSEVQNIDPKTNTNPSVSEKKEEVVVSANAEGDVAAEKNIEEKYQSSNAIAEEEVQSDATGSHDITAVEINEPRKVENLATKTVTAKDIEKPVAPFAESKTLNDKVAMESTATQKSEKKSKSVADAAVPTALSGTAFNGNTGNFDFTIYDAGVNAFNAGDYNSAVGSMNVLLQSQPNSINVNYYAGAANYELKNYNKAISQLNIVILNKRNTFYEAALWYKGNALLKMDDKKEAKTTLQKVVKQNGKYKQQAEALLKDL